MKPLPEELEIMKVFDIIREVSDMKTPDINNVQFESTLRHNRAGACNDVGVVYITLVHGVNPVCTNINFVDTVVHEVVHYNQQKLSHNDQFYCTLKELRNKVVSKLNERGIICH